jgi:hypothetical protein
LQVVRAEGAVAFDDSVLTKDGEFQFTFSGAANTKYAIQTSTNLTAWTPLTNLTITTSSQKVSDPDAKNSRYRFYRAISQ